TLLSSGEKAVNGFRALEDLDLDGDFAVDNDEAEAAGIQIWRDRNVNGSVEAGELLSFEEAGVLSVGTRYRIVETMDEYGNAHKWQGSFTRSDGSKALAVDVIFVFE
ncbi:MAG: hypothetical protein LBS84_04595, partial [Clostridiales bacterium]|nr:hypothetical protein [Clostridiales bacterium]